MITVIYSTHKDKTYNNNFKSHLTKTIGVKEFEILEFENFGQYSLAEVYNKGISQSKYDIVVCLHNDVKLETGWGKKLMKDFQNNPDYGIIGKAGSCYFPESGVYWERMQWTMVGQVYHHPEGSKKWLSQYSPKLPFLIPVVTIDGLFISFDKQKIKHTFDETIGKFHFYDHPFALSNYLDGVKIGVTSSFEITHESVGRPNDEFWQSKEVFLNKFKNVLPLDLKPSEIYCETIKEKPIKKIGKVAVIIPTKSKLNLLFQCIESFVENCNSEYYDIFIADTGSSKNEIEDIKQFIFENSKKVNIKLIEYDYYNFAKINNDVVVNHVNDSYEFLLFTNNDIKLKNNVIQTMLSVFKEKPLVGTVGCRLHFEDNTIQHNGILTFLRKSDNVFRLTHKNFTSYYNYDTTVKEVVGNTGALLMIRKNTFIKAGMFNENYLSCFEDVELNIKLITMGYKNYLSGKSVAYHYESQTRSEDPKNMEKFNLDYMNTLYPFVVRNFEKFKQYVMVEG